MKYNNEIINMYSEKDIESCLLEYLKGNYSKINAIYMELDKTSDRNVNLLGFRLALENYVLKYFKQPKTLELENAMKKLVRSIGENFSRKKINMLNSLFLQKENLNIFYKENELEIINNTMDSLKKKTFSLYQKFSRGETLSNHEVKILMNYFIYNKDASTDTYIYKAQVSYLQYLFKDFKAKITNVDELEFVANFTVVDYFRVFDKHVSRPEVLVGNSGKNLRGQSHGPLVKINDQDLFANKLGFLKTINHECRHAVQSKDARLYKRKTSYEMAKREIFSRYLSSNEFDTYKTNYRFEDIEKDAEKRGYLKTRAMTNRLLMIYK